ncbi:hypothetical protein GCM10010145_56040 [Streptomyces ruber]|uniref:Uncharacterized protein n=2 Tax=Streptomyces TaxID=1883 RepID=A0A918BM54_9ACTN|nr:hypothetical protein [Streptomyces ruber]GGQ79109.1 hypothetical protein GCM10010145_56040 [Streptomyces ruber]
MVKNEWTYFEVTATAPVGATPANAAPAVPDFPPSTDVLWATHVMIRPAGGSPEEFPLDVRTGGEVMRVIGLSSWASDAFTRSVTDGWGSAGIGGAWTNAGGAGSDHDVTGTAGTHTLTSADVARLSTLAASTADFEVQADVATGALATGGPQYVSVVGRAADGNDLYMARLAISTAQVMTLTLRKRVAGVETRLGTYTTTLTHTAHTFYRLRFQGDGTALKARAWTASGTDPVGWQPEATESDLAAAGIVGCRSMRGTFDNWRFSAPVTAAETRLIAGSGEIQGASGSERFPVRARLTTVSVFEVDLIGGAYNNITGDSGGLIDAATSFGGSSTGSTAWASGFALRLHGHYQAA